MITKKTLENLYVTYLEVLKKLRYLQFNLSMKLLVVWKTPQCNLNKNFPNYNQVI